MQVISSCRLLPLISLAFLPSCDLFVGFEAVGEQRRQIAHVPASALQVDSSNGRIEVVGGQEGQEVRVVAQIRCKGSSQAEADERLAAVKLICERDEQKVLRIRVVFPDKRRSSEGASLKVYTPGAKDVRLTSSNGSLAASQLSGPIHLKTSNGGIQLQAHQGDAVIVTSNGSVSVKDHGGALQAESSNGQIRAELGSGQKGPLKLRSSNGSIKAVVDAAFEGRVELRTSNGRARVSDPASVAKRIQERKRSASAQFGDSKSASSLRSSNGSVTLEVRGQ